jgi:hypothetical protein
MIAIICVLTAFPLGYLMRNRLAALTTYSIAYLWAFVFQTLYLLLDSLGGGSAPAFEAGEFPLSYGLVTLAIFLAGLGLASLGHWVRGRRRERTPSSVGAGVA